VSIPRTVRVPALSKRALQDLRETRFAIEGLAIARAASNMSAESLATLEQLIEAQAETDAEHLSERSDGIAAPAVLEADICREFDLVMSDESLWQSGDGVA
jgi:DNA-binding GntR family transcriptional regulator